MAIWYGCAASHVYLGVPGYLALAAAGSAAVAKHPLGVAVTLPVVPELSVALARALRARPVRLSPDPLAPGGSGQGAPEAPDVRGCVSIGFRAWAFGARGLPLLVVLLPCPGFTWLLISPGASARALRARPVWRVRVSVRIPSVSPRLRLRFPHDIFARESCGPGIQLPRSRDSAGHRAFANPCHLATW